MKSELTQERNEILERIRSYFITGGLFNPEMANHDAVAELISKCGQEIESLLSDRATLQRRCGEMEAAIESCRKVIMHPGTDNLMIGVTEEEADQFADDWDAARAALASNKPCTCHPDDKPPWCPQKFALKDCIAACSGSLPSTEEK